MPTSPCRSLFLASASSRLTSVMLLIVTLALPAADAAPRKRLAKPSKANGRRIEIKAGAPTRLPFRLAITPASHPETVIQCAVGATTMLIFDLEKPVGLKSGLFEQLGFEKSDKDYPGHVVYLRPTKALTGLTTNVVIETDVGRASFFVKVVHPEDGAKPGDFHGEVHIRTAGAERAKRKLEEKITELSGDVERARNQVAAAEGAMAKAEGRASEARDEGRDEGRAEALAAMAQLPLKGRKGRAVNAFGMRLRRLAGVEAEGATWWLVYELRNTGKVPRKLEGVSVSGEGRTAVHAPAGDVLPGQSVRVSLWVSGAKAAEQLAFHVTGGTIKTGVAK